MHEEQDRPWERLDRALASALEPELPALADELIGEIGDAIPDYRRPLEGAFGRGVRVGVQRSLQQFVDLIGRGDGVSAASREVYRELGRGELRSGRALDALQAAYRLGARLSWRRLSAVARQRGASAETIALLAESIFAYIEEVSACSVEGYAEAQADIAGERERRRRRLVRLLVQEREAPAEAALRSACEEAGWDLPGSLAAIACDLPDDARLATLAAGGAIAARLEDVTCLLVPDPDAPGRRGQLGRALDRAAAGRGDGEQARQGGGQPMQGGEQPRQGGEQARREGARAWHAAIGPTVPVAQAWMSFARASEALRLQASGVLDEDGLLSAGEHLLALLVHRDETLIAELAKRRLSPFQDLSPRSRQRLQATLGAWLRHRGSIGEVAAELHVHRQTVRYRLGRLKELLGQDLEHPDRRLELELALRWAGGERQDSEGDASNLL